MSDAAIQPAVLPASIAQQLRRLRRSLALWLWANGLSRLLLVVGGLVLLDLLVDWSFRMDRVQRALVLAMALSTIAWIVVRHLFRPLLSTLDDDALCLRVEARHGELNESLISAVQFSRRNDAVALGLSPAMVRGTIDQGIKSAESIDFRDVLDDREFRLNLLLVMLGLVALVAIGVAVARTEPMWVWFDRNVLLGDSRWRQDTYLLVPGAGPDNTLSLPRGDDWVQVVEADPQHVVPSLVYLDYKPVKGRRVTEQMVQVGDHQFHTEFKNMLQEFQFRAHGGDAYTEWIRVRLVDRPAVDQLKLVLSPPAYTGGKPEPLPPGKGPYDALKGSRLEISGAASKDLVRASLQIGEKTRSMRVDGRRFYDTIAPRDLAAGPYTLELTDTQQLDSKRPVRFALRIRADREPSIRARLEGISGMIVPAARIPIVMTIEDDFAITGARLVYQWRTDGSEQSGSSGQLEFEEIAKRLGQAKIAYSYPLDARPLGLAAGSSLTFHVEADDNDNVSAQDGKTGKSDAFLLRVVTEEELRADLLRREKEQRQEVERLLKDQEELETECRVVLATSRNKPAMPDDQRQAVIKLQKRQYLASERAAVIARQLGQLMAEVENNRLEEEDGPVRRRLEGQIIAPLQELADEDGAIRQAADLLDAARRAPSSPKLRDQALAGAAVEQERVVKSLREILKHMAKSEGYQEAVNLLYAILKSQGDVNEITVKEAQQRIRDILEGRSRK